MTEHPYSALARARRVRALVRKEVWQIFRDPSSILIAFVLPLVLIFLFGYGVSLDTTHTRIGVALERGTPTTRSLLTAFQASRYFDVRVATDRRELEEPLALGALRGIVVIPATFDSDFWKRTSSPAVQVIVDGSDPNTAALVQGYVQGVVANWADARAIESGRVRASSGSEQRFWFNAELSSRFFLVPGSIAIVMAMVGTLLTSLVVAREWERGTMEAIMATPVTTEELLLGKIDPLFHPWTRFDEPLHARRGPHLQGPVPRLGGSAVRYLVCVPPAGARAGAAISAATKNQFLASQLALISSFLPTFLLSGFLFEIPSMPKVIQWITNLVAGRWLIPSLQTVFLAGDVWPLFLRDIGVMVLFGAVFLVLAARMTKKRVA